MATIIPFPQICFPNANAESLMKRLVKGQIKFPYHNTTGILLYGDVGNGKSAVAPSFAEAMQQRLDPTRDANVRTNHVRSGNNGVSLIDKLYNECFAWPQSSLHYQVINEFDNLTPDAMAQFKSLMDEVEGHVVWILTTNNLHKIDSGVIGRCHAIDYDPDSATVWVPFVQQELKKRGLTMNQNQIINKIVMPAGNNLRGILRQIEII